VQRGGAGTELLEYDEVDSVCIDGERNRKVLPLEIGMAKRLSSGAAASMKYTITG